MAVPHTIQRSYIQKCGTFYSYVYKHPGPTSVVPAIDYDFRLLCPAKSQLDKDAFRMVVLELYFYLCLLFLDVDSAFEDAQLQ